MALVRPVNSLIQRTQVPWRRLLTRRRSLKTVQFGHDEQFFDHQLGVSSYMLQRFFRCSPWKGSELEVNDSSPQRPRAKSTVTAAFALIEALWEVSKPTNPYIV
jgi:hypothetical protein